MGFFRSFYLICYSPSSMFHLYKAGIWRAVLHTFLASICCAFLATVIFAILNCNKYRDTAESFDKEFGGVTITADTFLPVKEPAKTRTWFSDPLTAVTYVPAGTAIPDVPIEAVQGLVWTPEILFMWKYAGENAAVTWIRLSDHKTLSHTMEKSAMNPTLKGIMTTLAGQEAEKAEQAADRQTQEVDTITISNSFGSYFTLFGIILMITSALGYFLLAVFISGIFLLCSRLFKGRCNTLSAGEYWTVLLYTGFPPMLLGSIISGLGLDISYYTVYIFGMVIYLIFVLARLDKFLQAENK